MDKSKNKKVYLYAYIFSFLIVLIFFSLIVYKKTQNNTLGDGTSEKNQAINKMINSGNYEEIINELEKVGTGNLERDEKMKLVYSYLNYGNYFYKEEENSKKAMDILNTLEDDFEVFYFKGYAQEIIKNYTEALGYYNKGLEINSLSNKDKAVLKNQIGHVYDLKGEFDKVFSYYIEAYKLDQDNENVLGNLGRYYARKGEFEESYKFMNKALEKSTNLPSKSEISFSLSSLELELNGLTPDIDKSIDYARQSIDYYPNYSMGYTALARGLYMKNDVSLAKEIESNLDKSISLNPDGSYAYELYALHKMDQKDYTGALDYIKLTIDAIPRDMILMESERESKMTSMWFDSIMLGTLKQGEKNQELLLRLIEKTGSFENQKILFQVKRNNYGVFEPLKDNRVFKKLIDNYKQ
ncbi:hypothetical protein EOM39_04045 [Candidatus Gracilibacteria bacterium]|nr:hypothetical protein [Candidatus Gracilibacteria bacterium]